MCCLFYSFIFFFFFSKKSLSNPNNVLWVKSKPKRLYFYFFSFFFMMLRRGVGYLAPFVLFWAEAFLEGRFLILRFEIFLLEELGEEEDFIFDFFCWGFLTIFFRVFFWGLFPFFWLFFFGGMLPPVREEIPMTTCIVSFLTLRVPLFFLYLSLL